MILWLKAQKFLPTEKTVLLPEIQATCPMAQMVSPEELAKARQNNPDKTVVAYVNTTAKVKALTDICCTSAKCVGNCTVSSEIVKSFLYRIKILVVM